MTDKKMEDPAIDFSALAGKIKSWFATKPAGMPGGKHTSSTASDNADNPKLDPKSSNEDKDSIALDFKQIASTWKKHARWLIPLFCIILAMSLSIYLRTMPLRMPIAESWSENNAYNFYRNQLQSQVQQQYPNLPEANQNALVAKQWGEFFQNNKALIDNQIQQLAQNYRNFFRDDNGTTYLLGIDPYYYYRQTEYVLTYGFPGTEIRDGKYWDTYRLAPLGREAEPNFHSWFGAQLHRFIKLFWDIPLMLSFFLVGTIFSALTVIPAFFIGRRISGNNVGAFFTATLIAVSSFFVARTTGESSDTDVYAVFFPVFITWMFLEMYTSNDNQRKLFWMGLAGFSTGVFAYAWTGWWYIATFIVAAMIAHLLALLFTHRKQITSMIKSNTFHEPLRMLGMYVISAAVFISLFTSVRQFVRVILGPFQFLQLKAVGVANYWPNIRTTVAELNVPSFSNVIQQFDGRMYFALALLGIVFVLLKKNEQGKRDITIPFFLALWFAASAFATTKGVRFILQLTPVFAISLGACLGIAWHYASQWLSRELRLPKVMTQVVLFFLLGLILIQPLQSGYGQAYNSIPSMNDAWFNALLKLKHETAKDSIITSWWDFGHWFKAVANRPVTFDGGTQTWWGAYWVGKSLLTSNEKSAIGIIHLLNCGQNNAFKELDKILQDPAREIDLLNEIILVDRKEAVKVLNQEGLNVEQIASVLRYTHCENPPMGYFITSEDMVGKAGVWGHFGSWNFWKGVGYQKVRKMERKEGLAYLQKTFRSSEEDAERMYQEIQTTPADRWIAPWPGYLSGRESCAAAGSILRCSASFQGQRATILIDLEQGTASFENSPGAVPNSLVYPTKDDVVVREQEGQKVGFSAVVIPNGDSFNVMLTDPSQAGSMFTRLFFLEGHGTKCFKKFDDSKEFASGRIITWEVDYNCKQQNKVYFLPEPQVHAAHILISTQQRSEAEALQLLESIRSNITAANFAAYAQSYSEDPGSRQQGGDLGWFKKGIMVPEFEETAFSLPAGEISKPVKTQFGYHLILVLEKKET